MPFIACKNCRKMLTIEPGEIVAFCEACRPKGEEVLLSTMGSPSSAAVRTTRLTVQAGTSARSPWIPAAGATMFVSMALLWIYVQIFGTVPIWLIVVFLVAILISVALALIGVADSTSSRPQVTMTSSLKDKSDLVHNWGWKIARGARLMFVVLFGIGAMITLAIKGPLFVYPVMALSIAVLSAVIGFLVYLIIVAPRIGFYAISGLWRKRIILADHEIASLSPLSSSSVADDRILPA